MGVNQNQNDTPIIIGNINNAGLQAAATNTCTVHCTLKHIAIEQHVAAIEQHVAAVEQVN